jgi:hypothetical protein
MAKARCSDEWDRAAPVICILANANRNPKRHGPFSVSDFHPYRKSESPGVRVTCDNIRILRGFVQTRQN